MSEKTKFKCAYDPVVVRQSGDQIDRAIIDDYIIQIGDDGEPHVVPAGKRDIYAEIQAGKPDSLAEMVARYGAEGLALRSSATVLPDSCYGDQDNLRGDMGLAYDALERVSGTWESVPADVRSIFGTPQAFLASVEDGSFAEKIQKISREADPDGTHE